MHRYCELGVEFPVEIISLLNEIYKRYDLITPHNFLKIFVNGQWVTVDATWDSPLKKFGFTINENWDGISDMKLCVESREIFETKDPDKMKKEILGKIPDEIQNLRKLFLKKLTDWLNSVR